jgi:hypothetical protein
MRTLEANLCLWSSLREVFNPNTRFRVAFNDVSHRSSILWGKNKWPFHQQTGLVPLLIRLHAVYVAFLLATAGHPKGSFFCFTVLWACLSWPNSSRELVLFHRCSAHSGGPVLISRTGPSLRAFSRSLKTKIGVVLQVMQRRLPSTSFPSHYSPNTTGRYVICAIKSFFK